jgi:putrescine transport system permease protein
MNASNANNEVIKPLNMNFRDAMWQNFITYLPYLWLLLFFLAPFIIVLKISFATPIVAQPPFTELFDFALIQVSGGWLHGKTTNF